MVACDLWRAVSPWSDIRYGNFDLHFVKNKEQQAVDFFDFQRSCAFSAD